MTMKKEDHSQEIICIPDDNSTIIKNKIKLFFQTNTAVHIKGNSRWFNGYIKAIEKSVDDSDCTSQYFIIQEFEDGETPIFYVEVQRIDKYKSKEEKENENQTQNQ